MENSKPIIGIIILIIVGAGGIFLLSRPSPEFVGPPVEQKGQTPTTEQTASVTSTTTVKTYSMTEVASHNTPTNCWTTINGNVYELTAWIAKHPGGEKAIISLCGIDGSASFNKQHGGQPNPEAALASFMIGKLQ